MIFCLQSYNNFPIFPNFPVNFSEFSVFPTPVSNSIDTFLEKNANSRTGFAIIEK